MVIIRKNRQITYEDFGYDRDLLSKRAKRNLKELEKIQENIEKMKIIMTPQNEFKREKFYREVLELILAKLENSPEKRVSIHPKELFSLTSPSVSLDLLHDYLFSLKKKGIIGEINYTGAAYKYFYLDKINKEKLVWELKAIEKEINKKIEGRREENSLKSIHLLANVLIGDRLDNVTTIFLVLDEHFEMPIRCPVKNKNGEPTYIKKLYDIAYFVPHAPGKRVEYDKRIADNINNTLFKRKIVAKYMKTNKLKKPTLVKKSETGNYLVLTNEVQVITGLVKNVVPIQFQYLYIDKTK